MEIRAIHVMDVWKRALDVLVSQGKSFTDRSSRSCIELTNIFMLFDDPTVDINLPLETVSRVTDIIYPSMQELQEIVFMRNRSVYAYSFGQRLFNFGNSCDQIDGYIIPLLRERPMTRRAVVSLYDPQEDCLLDADAVLSLISVHFMIREGKLHVTAYIRSADIFVGFPANIFQISVLQKYVAQHLDIPVGSIGVFTNSAHIFEDQVADIQKVIRSS